MSRGAGGREGAHEERQVCWDRLTADASPQPGLWAPATPATGEAGALAQKEALLCPQGRTVIRERLPARPSTGRGGLRGRALNLMHCVGCTRYPAVVSRGRSQVGMNPEIGPCRGHLPWSKQGGADFPHPLLGGKVKPRQAAEPSEVPTPSSSPSLRKAASNQPLRPRVSPDVWDVWERARPEGRARWSPRGRQPPQQVPHPTSARIGAASNTPPGRRAGLDSGGHGDSHLHPQVSPDQHLDSQPPLSPSTGSQCLAPREPAAHLGRKSDSETPCPPRWLHHLSDPGREDGARGKEGSRHPCRPLHGSTGGCS